MYETYTSNTSCFITDLKNVILEERECGSVSGRDAGCVTNRVNYRRINVSYIIDNGTLVNSRMTIHWSYANDYKVQAFVVA